MRETALTRSRRAAIAAFGVAILNADADAHSMWQQSGPTWHACQSLGRSQATSDAQYRRSDAYNIDPIHPTQTLHPLLTRTSPCPPSSPPPAAPFAPSPPHLPPYTPTESTLAAPRPLPLLLVHRLPQS